MVSERSMMCYYFQIEKQTPEIIRIQKIKFQIYYHISVGLQNAYNQQYKCVITINTINIINATTVQYSTIVQFYSVNNRLEMLAI